ncbi:MAG: uracil-DNA glycosylase, partial [Candidatus Aerophobetes bacterium]|nr:uracil-DNA glycosylase [Candidatus Aerophobetes bacterium]
LVGEAPGKNEDLQGKPFVGAAGNILTEALERFNIPVSQIYIANILKCRPPANRDPSPEEIETCFPYLKKQIEIINPHLICTLGKFATQVLLNTNQGVTSLRGRRQYYKKIPLFPTFHPAACIYKPNWKRLFLQDIESVKKILASEF